MIDVNPDDFKKHLTEKDRKILKSRVGIKPCPFCGDRTPQLLESVNTCWISCTNSTCEADGPVKQSAAAAEFFWNGRENPKEKTDV